MGSLGGLQLRNCPAWLQSSFSAALIAPPLIIAATPSITHLYVLFHSGGLHVGRCWQLPYPNVPKS